MTATIEYQIATYRGTVEVQCEPNDENDVLFARAKQELIVRCHGALPFGSESFRIMDRSYGEE
jgi:hypothetical protein